MSDQTNQNESNVQAPAQAAAPSFALQSTHTLRVSSLYKSFGKKQVVKGVDFPSKPERFWGFWVPMEPERQLPSI